MKLVIDLNDVKAAEFNNKETGEVINYKTFALTMDDGDVKYMSMNKINELLKVMKSIL